MAVPRSASLLASSRSVDRRRDWLASRYVSCTWDMEELVSMKDKIVKNDLLKVRLDVGTD